MELLQQQTIVFQPNTFHNNSAISQRLRNQKTNNHRERKILTILAITLFTCLIMETLLTYAEL